MQQYRCKCGKRTAWGSMSLAACQGCEECNTTFAQHPDRHKPLAPHAFKTKYKDDGTPFEWCDRCGATGKTLRKPLTLPGRKAMHAWITDECRTNHGDDGVTEEVVRRLREALGDILNGWKQGLGAKFNIVVTVEPPESEAVTEPLIGMTSDELTGDADDLHSKLDHE